MPKPLRRAAASLVVAGTVAAVPAAPAQTSPYLSSRPATAPQAAPMKQTACTPAPAVRPAAADPTDRLTEFQVQLAWMADPVTFPFTLTARVFGSNLEVHGSVPNDVVRAHAVKVAREHSSLAVADALRVQPGLAVAPVVTTDTKVLAPAAAHVLKQVLPRYAMGFEVHAQPQGLVILKGPIPSYEEKLQASQQLRGLRGCTAIDNQLEVLKVQFEGKSYVAVSADGSQLASCDGRPMRPAAPVMAAASPKPAVVTTPAPKAAPVTGSVVAAKPVAPSVLVQKPSVVAQKPPVVAQKPPVSENSSGSAITRVGYVQAETHLAPPKPMSQPVQPVKTAMAQPALLPPLPAPKPMAAPASTSVSSGTQDALLKQRVEKCCGVWARDVEVVLRSPNNYLVRMTVRDTTTGEHLGRQVLALPEFGPYQVDVQVHVVP